MKEFKVENSSYILMYSLYSLPNLVIPLLGGLMIDKFGANLVLIYAATMPAIG